MDGAGSPDRTVRPQTLVSGATLSTSARALIIVAMLVGLYLTSLASYLLFHTFAEAFFTLVSVSVLVVAWNLRDFQADDFPLFLGIALASIAVLRVVHTVAFEGMGVLDSASANHATQLWIAAGYVSAFSLVTAPAAIGRRINAGLTALAYAAIVLVLVVSIFLLDVFPVAYASDGLTPFKKTSEYIIAAMILVSLGVLLRKRRRLDTTTVRLMTAALVTWAASELAFTSYVDVYDTVNLTGHLLSVLSAYLIYSAVVEAGLARPHALDVADLQKRERQARVAHDRAEAERGALDGLLEITPGLHGEASYDEVARLVCSGASDVFEADWSALLRVDGEDLVVLAREPATAMIRAGTRFPLAREPRLREIVGTKALGFLPDGSIGLLVPGGDERRDAPRGTSALLVPIGGKTGHAPMKVLIVSLPEERSAPDDGTLALVHRFADQVTVALAQAGRREAQERAARLHQRLEASLLPSLPLEVPGLRIATWYRPGEQRLYLGGDFVDMARLDDGRLAVIVGDVSGHGPDAAALGATLRAGWRALTLNGAGPHETIDTLARVLRHENPSYEMFVTCCAAWLDPDRRVLSIIDMGHPLPLLVAGTVREVEARPYPPLGVLEDVRWEPATIGLPAAWTLAFYTDGLIEGRLSPDAEERFGAERLGALLQREFAVPPVELDGEAVLERVVSAVVAANGGPLPDDVVLVTVTSEDGEADRGPRAASVSGREAAAP